MWTQESGRVTHDTDSVPTITAGSANGYFNTDHYFDLRNRNGLLRACDDPQLRPAPIAPPGGRKQQDPKGNLGLGSFDA
jgi:hypothetical protein